MFVGEIAALTAAFMWAASSVVYRFLGQSIPPLSLNILKGAVAIALIGITQAILPTTFETDLSWRFWLLALSGVVGIGLGDTAYFFALNSLGARKTLLLETLSPPLGALLAWIFIGEVMQDLAWQGIALTLLGIIWVIGEQQQEIPNRAIEGKGFFWAIAAALAQAVGAVLSRAALIDSDVSSLTSSLIRISAGVFCAAVLSCLPMFVAEKTFRKRIFSLSARTFGIVILAATGSTYLGIWLQQVSLKYAPTGIAQTLLATSPLFVIPISLALKERVSLRSLGGAIIAIAGIGLLFVPVD